VSAVLDSARRRAEGEATVAQLPPTDEDPQQEPKPASPLRSAGIGALVAVVVLAALVVGVGVGVGAVSGVRLAVGPSGTGATTATSRTASGASSATSATPVASTTASLGATATTGASAVSTASLESTWTAAKNGQLVKRVKLFKSVPAPKGLAISPDNREVWVTALVTKPSIGIYNPRTGKKRGEVNLGSAGAVEIIFNRAGTRAYASQMQTHRVYEIDVKKRAVRRTFNTGSPWTKVILLSPDEKRLYAANWSGDDVSVISMKSGKLIRRIKTADTPRGLYVTPNGKKLYVACFGEQTLKGTIQVFNLRTGKGRTIGRGRAMRHMVADEQRHKLFTSDLGANCIWVTDLETDKTKLFAKTDHDPNTIDISPDGRVLFVSNRGKNNPVSYNLRGPEWGSVLLLDTVTGKPLDAIVGGNQCTALDVSSDGKLLAFSDFLDGKLRVYKVPPTDVLLAGKGGAYKWHLRHVCKDGSKLKVTLPSSVRRD